MKRRKMNKKMNNKGFTLVELIVVLVILAILAAILVPTLMGYIDKAKSEKDFSTAQSIRVATQSVLAEMYAKGEATSEIKTHEGDIMKLVGAVGKTTGEGENAKSSYTIDGQTVSLGDVTFDGDSYQIKSIEVKINDSTYTYDSAKNTWEAKKTTN